MALRQNPNLVSPQMEDPLTMPEGVVPSDNPMQGLMPEEMTMADLSI